MGLSEPDSDCQPAEVVRAVEERNVWFTATVIPKLLLYAVPGCNTREPQISWCREQLQNLTVQPVGNGFHHLNEEQPQAVADSLYSWILEIPAGYAPPQVE